MSARPALFLDRDGTLLREVPYLDTPTKVRLLPGVSDALATLHSHGLLLIVVSNQSGVARGLLDEGKLFAIQKKIDEELLARGARIDAWYHCPHHNQVGTPPHRRICRCRKPLPGLLERAIQDFDIDLDRSIGVGDDVRDLQAFAALNLRSVLVGTGKGRQARQKLAEIGKEPDLYCAHFAEAVPWILKHCTKKQLPSSP
ncbi:MAG: HAD family hydrolase [Planctomycetota bacterium]|jgi:D-glycero-D-manno-heptose 1,7-bisphosphate phosphatase|nr:HAD family hydrolase [Planctomycetota bacterium]|tara:strand:- start:2227 stop:2826 length:600 start_codon:yes stop_codon:yes gene_type:complete